MVMVLHRRTKAVNHQNFLKTPNQCDQIWRNFAALAKFYNSLGNFYKVKLVTF